MSARRLALSLAAFFVALALPSSILVYQAYGQLKWEAFHQHQRLARELTLRIDAGFARLIEREEKRPISDYEFLNVAGSGDNAILQRSPLSALPQASDVPGLLGYFQVDAEGRLRTPILPADSSAGLGLSSAELAQRRRQEREIRDILDRNRLVGKSEAAAAPPAFDDEDAGLAFAEPPSSVAAESAPAPAAPAAERRADEPARLAFDELLGVESGARSMPRSSEQRQRGAKISDLNLADSFAVAGEEQAEAAEPDLAVENYRPLRKEQVNLPRQVLRNYADTDYLAEREFAPARPATREDARSLRIETFESEVEPMTFALLDSGHFVLFRRVWHDEQRQVQGLLLDADSLLGRLVEPAFRQSALASMSRLLVAYRGDILEDFRAAPGRGYPAVAAAGEELLLQSRLVAPFGDLELIFTMARFPLGAGGRVILWSALVLALVLIAGVVLLYRLGLRQLALARQQQDFVSAVSHELKTPLTSIRMYGEMLRAGWVDEEKRRTYYDYIFHEAERLTRLINNVLQLARLTRNEQQASLERISVARALDELEPRLRSQLEPTGFELAIERDPDADAVELRIDIDWFIQVFINLVDNAVKFSADASPRRVEFACRRLRDGGVQFSVRDYGPGIAADQMKKIFRLFYRSENELTRETVGTGIGLALVRQLAAAMGAEIDVVNREPGAEFRLQFGAGD